MQLNVQVYQVIYKETNETRSYLVLDSKMTRVTNTVAAKIKAENYLECTRTTSTRKGTCKTFE